MKDSKEKPGKLLKDYFKEGSSKIEIAKGDSLLQDEQSKDDLYLLTKGKISVVYTQPIFSQSVAVGDDRRTEGKNKRIHFNTKVSVKKNENVQSSGITSWFKGVVGKSKKEEAPGDQGTIEAPVVFGKGTFDIFAPKKVMVVANTYCELLQMPIEKIASLQGDPNFQSLLNKFYRKKLLAYQLRNLPYFPGLTKELVDDLASKAELLSFRPNHNIVKAGERVDAFYIIRSGSVRVVQTQPDSKPKVRYFESGSYFGENVPLLKFGFEVVEGQTPSRPDYVLRGGKKMFVLRHGFKILGVPAGDIQLIGERMDKVFFTIKLKDGKLYLNAKEGSLPIRINGKKTTMAPLTMGDEIRVGDYTLKCNIDIRGLRNHKFSCIANDYVELIKINRKEFNKLCSKVPRIDAIFSRIRKERNRGVDDCLALRKELKEMRDKEKKEKDVYM